MSKQIFPKRRNRLHEATQILQALVTLVVLVIIYLSRNFFSADVTASSIPETPPMNNFPQKSYWNNDFQYGFQGEKDDLYKNRTLSGVDMVAVDSQEWVIFEDAKVRVSYYPSLPIEEIELRHQEVVPRAFSRLAKWIAVIEGDLDSSSAKTILATLHTR